MRPFVTIARVFNACDEFDRGTIGNIRKGRVGDMLPLSGQQFQEPDALWVADLRLEGSIERGILVEKTVIEGFSSEDQYLQFQRSLAAIRNRSALDDRVIQYLTQPLKERLNYLGSAVTDSIEEIRIRARPSVLSAQTVELYVLLSDDADEDLMRGHADSWYANVTTKLPNDLRLIDITVVPASQFTRADEIGSERLDYDSLSEVA